MIGNVAREIGHYEKQSSCWFQAKSALNTLIGNIMFNMPRAAININDGFGGGNDVSEVVVCETCQSHHTYQELLFNTCRESTDHGCIASSMGGVTCMQAQSTRGIANHFSPQCSTARRPSNLPSTTSIITSV